MVGREGGREGGTNGSIGAAGGQVAAWADKNDFAENRELKTRVYLGIKEGICGQKVLFEINLPTPSIELYENNEIKQSKKVPKHRACMHVKQRFLFHHLASVVSGSFRSLLPMQRAKQAYLSRSSL